jgi:hypothetical protein
MPDTLRYRTDSAQRELALPRSEGLSVDRVDTGWWNCGPGFLKRYSIDEVST